MFPRTTIMTKVDFYLIKENSFTAGFNFICRLLEKAYQQKHAVYVQTSNEETAKTIDDLLWTFREDAFIPHNLAGQSEIKQSPILIGHAQAPEKPHDILVNLTSDILPFYADFNRVIEIVPNEPQAKEICRTKFRKYKEDQCELQTHDLTKM